MSERGDFYEDDEPVEDVVKAFESDEPVVTGCNPASDDPHGWFCQHFTITASHLLGKPAVGCGCNMVPLHSLAAA